MIEIFFTWLWTRFTEGVAWVASLLWDVWAWLKAGVEAIFTQLVGYLSTILPESVVDFLNQAGAVFGDLWSYLDLVDWFIPVYACLLIYVSAFIVSGWIRLIRYAMGLWFGAG